MKGGRRPPAALLAAALLVLVGASPVAGGGDPDPIAYELVLPLTLPEAWAAWTDPDRMEEWFAPEVEVDLRPGGTYAILFFPDRERGLRGAEWSELLAVVPERMLRFTWYAPPHLRDPEVQRTTVSVHLAALGPGTTRVLLEHDGWIDAEGWREVHAYFAEAWSLVLDRLAYRAEIGPWPWGAGPAPAEAADAPARRIRPVRLGSWGDVPPVSSGSGAAGAGAPAPSFPSVGRAPVHPGSLRVP